MYEIRLNEAILHVPDINSESRLSAGKIVEEVNQISSFSFTFPPANPLFSSELHDRKDIVSVKNTLTNKTEFEGVLMLHEQSMDSSGKLCIKASAEGFLGYLCDSIQLYKHYENTTPVDFLTALLEVHNSQVGTEKRLYLGNCNVASADYTGSKTTAYRTTLDEIRVNLIERIGGEIQVRKVGDKLYLDYLERIGMESSTAVELAENMKSLDVKTDSANIITRLIPLGTQINDETAERLTIKSVNDDKPYIDDESAVEKFGIIVGTVEFDDITLPEKLLESAEKYLMNNNRILKSYEAQILDLSILYSSHQSIECGNTYTFRNKFFGLDEPLRIIKKTTDIYKPYSPVVQIGDKTESITDIAVNQAKLIEYKLPEQKIDILTSAKATASNLIKSGFNGYVVANENEICIMDTKDKNTAQKVWRWNENGFGFSNTGYNGTYGTAMTMDGAIVADFITAGILRGIEIKNGDGTFSVSPDGTVSASAMNITGGTINIQATSDINDIISLSHDGNNMCIRPGYFRAKSSNNNAVQIDGRDIRGYSYIWQNEFTQTFQLNSATGSFITNGDISGKELYYSYNDERFSVRQEINKNHSEINSLSSKIDTNYSDLSEKIHQEIDSLQAQINNIHDTLGIIMGGGSS